MLIHCRHTIVLCLQVSDIHVSVSITNRHYDIMFIVSDIDVFVSKRSKHTQSCVYCTEHNNVVSLLIDIHEMCLVL